MSRILKLLTLFFIFTSPALAVRTFFIDYIGGSNSNPGTQVSPWKSHPYMNHSVGCDGGTGPTYAHQVGDQFIFKGSVSVPVACFPMVIQASGSAATPDYYGVCVVGDFYIKPACGGTSWPAIGWTRPLFDQAFTATSSNRVISTGSNLDFIEIDNFEIKNQLVVLTGDTGSSCQTLVGNSTPTFQSQAIYFQNTNGGSSTGAMQHTWVVNTYIHDWVTNHGPGGCLGCLHYATGSIRGASLLDGDEISGENSKYNNQTQLLYFGGGVDSGLTSGTSAYEIKNSKIHGGMAGAFSYKSVHDNEIYHESSEHGALDPCPHSQVVENDDGGIESVYNNLIHDNQGRGGQNVGVVVYEGPASTISNNVMYNNNISGFNGNILLSEGNSGSQPSAVANIENNTVDCSNGVPCFATDSKATITGTVNLINNNWITNGAPLSIVSAITTFNKFPSANGGYVMSTTEANTNGFTAANFYKPTTTDANVAGKGNNLSSTCSTLAALCLTTSAGLHLSPVNRPSTGNWDFGATPAVVGIAAAMSVNPTSISFGSIQLGSTSGNLSFSISNTGTANLILSNPYFTLGGSNPADFLSIAGGCTPGGSVSPGSACSSTWKFKPSIAGAESATVNFNGNASAGPFTMSGTGLNPAVPIVVLNPATQFNYGTVLVGNNSPKAFTISNTGTATLGITSITSSDNVQYPISAQTCGVSLAAGSACGWTVTFTPGSAGLVTATITLVTTNASPTTYTINLSGTGQPVVTNPVPAPAITIFTLNLGGTVWKCSCSSMSDGTYNCSCK